MHVHAGVRTYARADVRACMRTRRTRCAVRAVRAVCALRACVPCVPNLRTCRACCACMRRAAPCRVVSCRAVAPARKLAGEWAVHLRTQESQGGAECMQSRAHDKGEDERGPRARNLIVFEEVVV